MSYTRGFLSFDNSGTFDLPNEQREFNRRLLVLQQRTGVNLPKVLRTVARNREVGGNIYSQHLLGLAADYRLDQRLRRQDVPAFMAQARALGLVPVDETEKTKGTGPHVHVQAYPAGKIPKRIYTQIGVQIREDP